MMLQKFQDLLLLGKLMTILKSQGMKEKIVAEYILNMLKSTQGLENFKKALHNIGTDFDVRVTADIYAVVYPD
jgi:hypothetical protein